MPKPKKSFIIVIYEEVPEHCYIAVIPTSELDDTIRACLDTMNGKLVNCDDVDTKASELMFDLFYEDEAAECCSGNNVEYNCRLGKYKKERRDPAAISSGGIVVEKIYHIGMVL